MGVCASNVKDKDLTDEDLGSTDSEDDDKEVKLLLLGAGESGKSTFVKQMQIIHLAGFDDDARSSFKPIIYQNILLGMNNLIEGAAKFGNPVSVKDAAERVKTEAADVEERAVTSISKFSADLKALWADAGIKKTFEKRSDFWLQDNLDHYFNDIERVAKDSYVPTEDDLLRARAKTTGISTTVFAMDELRVKLVDVGGQRSERKKWIRCFENVTMVLFVVALSEYDLKLYEDDKTSRILESMKLFDEITNSKWFSETPIVLFLNKSDLFAEKITQTDLSVCFDDYKGGKNFDAAVEFLQKKFVALNKNPNKHIFVHVTCATDTKNITRIFQNVKEHILATAFTKSDFL